MVTIRISAGELGGATVAGGENGRSVHFFGAVRYATANRFAAPEPVTPWEGVCDAQRRGAAPLQRSDGLDLVPDMTPRETTEDCLTAEIWSPANAANLPVIVWIPGGSFRIGGAGLETYDGRHLAADGDVVVVGLNYRLGLFGFLAVPGAETNIGLRDLRAGLAWVRANIASFGGDPNRVTLMGESAGAGAILHLLTDQELDCAGAIVLSGSPTMTQSPNTAAFVGAAVFEAAGVTTIEALRRLSGEQLLDVQSVVVAKLAASVGMMPFHPWVDGTIVGQAPLSAMAQDELAPIPLVVCTTADEMELFRAMVPRLTRDIALQMLSAKGVVLGLSAQGVSAGLSACDDDLVSAIADIDLQIPALRLCEHHRRRGLPVWRASFTWESAQFGSCHAVDLPFHFGTLDVSEWRAFAEANQSAADRLSRRMRHAWAEFAHDGHPACDPIGPWPLFDDESMVVELGREIRALSDPAAPRLGSWG